MADPGPGKSCLRLFKQRAIGRLATKRDPGKLCLRKQAAVGRGQQPAQERGCGRKDGCLLIDDRPSDRVGVAQRRHNEPAAGQQRLSPDLDASPTSGIVDQEPAKAVPLLGEPRSGKDGVPGSLHQFWGAARARSGDNDMRRPLVVATRPRQT